MLLKVMFGCIVFNVAIFCATNNLLAAGSRQGAGIKGTPNTPKQDLQTVLVTQVKVKSLEVVFDQIVKNAKVILKNVADGTAVDVKNETMKYFNLAKFESLVEQADVKLKEVTKALDNVIETVTAAVLETETSIRTEGLDVKARNDIASGKKLLNEKDQETYDVLLKKANEILQSICSYVDNLIAVTRTKSKTGAQRINTLNEETKKKVLANAERVFINVEGIKNYNDLKIFVSETNRKLYEAGRVLRRIITRSIKDAENQNKEGGEKYSYIPYGSWNEIEDNFLKSIRFGAASIGKLVGSKVVQIIDEAIAKANEETNERQAASGMTLENKITTTKTPVNNKKSQEKDSRNSIREDLYPLPDHVENFLSSEPFQSALKSSAAVVIEPNNFDKKMKKSVSWSNDEIVRDAAFHIAARKTDLLKELAEIEKIEKILGKRIQEIEQNYPTQNEDTLVLASENENNLHEERVKKKSEKEPHVQSQPNPEETINLQSEFRRLASLLKKKKDPEDYLHPDHNDELLAELSVIEKIIDEERLEMENPPPLPDIEDLNNLHNIIAVLGSQLWKDENGEGNDNNTNYKELLGQLIELYKMTNTYIIRLEQKLEEANHQPIFKNLVRTLTTLQEGQKTSVLPQNNPEESKNLYTEFRKLANLLEKEKDPELLMELSVIENILEKERLEKQNIPLLPKVEDLNNLHAIIAALGSDLKETNDDNQSQELFELLVEMETNTNNHINSLKQKIEEKNLRIPKNLVHFLSTYQEGIKTDSSNPLEVDIHSNNLNNEIGQSASQFVEKHRKKAEADIFEIKIQDYPVSTQENKSSFNVENPRSSNQDFDKVSGGLKVVKNPNVPSLFLFSKYAPAFFQAEANRLKNLYEATKKNATEQS